MIVIRGNTYPHKDALKAAGAKFDGQQKAWTCDYALTHEYSGAGPTIVETYDDARSAYDAYRKKFSAFRREYRAHSLLTAPKFPYCLRALRDDGLPGKQVDGCPEYLDPIEYMEELRGGK